jgi:hypothetical protein
MRGRNALSTPAPPAPVPLRQRPAARLSTTARPRRLATHAAASGPRPDPRLAPRRAACLACGRLHPGRPQRHR